MSSLINSESLGVSIYPDTDTGARKTERNLAVKGEEGAQGKGIVGNRCS